MLEKIKTILAGVNSEILSIANDVHKYFLVALAVIVAIGLVYKDFSGRVHRQELESESLLYLTPRNVHSAPLGLGRNNTMGTIVLQRNGPGTPKVETPSASEERPPYIPPEAEIIVTPKDPTKTLSDVVNVKIEDRYGFTLEPGLTGNLLPLGIGLDLKWAYYEKIGTEVGMVESFGSLGSISPSFSLSYRLDSFRLLANTEVEISYLPLAKIPVSTGIRINF